MENKSPFAKYGQVSALGFGSLDEIIVQSVMAARVFIYIVRRVDKVNELHCKYTEIQSYFGVSRTTISKAIKLLSDHGYIWVYKEGTGNVYIANPDIIWTSWAKNRQYCKFPPNVTIKPFEKHTSTKKTI